jgi:hypothetical protein
MSEMPRNAREFTLQLSKVLHEMHPELEDIGKVSPKGRPELKTRDAAQSTPGTTAENSLSSTVSN